MSLRPARSPVGGVRSLFKDEAMTRYDTVTGLPARAGRSCLWALGAFLLGLIGFGCTQPLIRPQADDENERERYDVRTVGDVTAVANPEPVMLGGVGLVVGLEGTGGEAPPSSYRTMLESELRKEGIHNIKEVLSSPDHALVVVEAQLPPGVCKGDPIDVEVKLPPGSRATSLRGGYLRKAHLYNYDFSRNLVPESISPQRMLLGHCRADAEGPILVGVGLADGDESTRVKQGRIWSGGRARVEQPFSLIMNPDQRFARMTSLIADRINETFHGGLRGSVDDKVAQTSNKLAVNLRVPAQYRLNLPRYLRVVRLIPLIDNVDAAGSDPRDVRSYRQRLGAELLDPAHTVIAALRLEALGAKSIPLLKPGLQHEHPLVRFCSAEALAYLGSPSCAEELGRAAMQQPLFRAFALAALASLNEAVCQNKLQELLSTAVDDETRFGAFRALHSLDEKNLAIRGEFLNDSFWLHRVAPKMPPLVHLSSIRRAEVVLFGEDAMLKPPFSFLAGEFAITATEDDLNCNISRTTRGARQVRKQCSFKLEDVLRTMAGLGGMYPEVITLLQQANSCGALSCRVRCDALPQAPSVYDLVRVGTGEIKGELVPSGQDLGLTPTLYELGLPSRPAQPGKEEPLLRDRRTRAGAPSGGQVAGRE
jgi:hypothetical protein